MAGKSTTTLACVVAVAIGTVTLLNAQAGRGEGPQAVPAREPSSASPCTARRSRATSKATPPIATSLCICRRRMPSDQARRYPVVYLLHGYGGRDDTFTERLAALQESSDRLAAAQGFSSAIVVTPNAYSLHKGSMYSSSPTTGDWERFIAEDLVAHIDGHYRTLADRMSRGLAGHSMGGYGAMRIGMKRPDVFFSLYLMSSCCLTANRNPQPDGDEGGGSDHHARPGGRGGTRPGIRSVGEPGVSGGVVPKSRRTRRSILDLPVKDGKLRPDIVAKWVANAPLEMIGQHAPEPEEVLRHCDRHRYRRPLLAANQQLHDALTRLRIPHHYEEYDGDHTNKVRDRIEMHVLPFFSKNLAAPANPTSPTPQN